MEGKTKEKTRVLAHSRRQKENDTFTDIAESLPIQENAKDLDKASILRVAIHYLKLRDVLRDGDELSDQEHTLEEDEEAISTPPPSNDSGPTIADFLPNYSKDVLQALDGFLLVVSRDGRVLFVSESITNYLGLRQVDVIGVHIQDIVHPQDCSEIINIFQTQGHDNDQVFDAKNPLRRNFVVRMRCAFTPSVRAITRCSNFKPIYCSCYLKFSQSGPSTGQFLGLTAMCRMASAPRIKEMFVGTFFKSKHGLDLSYASVDTRIRWILGYDPSEMMGLKAYQYFHPQDLSATSSCHMNLLSRGRSYSPCYRFMSRWGDWIWVRSDSHMMFNPISHLPDGIIIYTWIVRIDEEDERMKAVESGGDGEKERRKYDNFESSISSESGSLDLKKLTDPGIKDTPLTPPSTSASPPAVKPVKPHSTIGSPVSQQTTTVPSPPVPLQPLTLPISSQVPPHPSAPFTTDNGSPQSNSVFGSPDSAKNDYPPNINPFHLKQTRRSCALSGSVDHSPDSVIQGAEVIDQSAFSDSHQLHQSFLSPPYTPYNQGKHTPFDAHLAFETNNSPYATYPTPAYAGSDLSSPPDLQHHHSPSEQLSPEGIRYGSISPPHSVSPNPFSSPYKLQDGLQITSQASEFLVDSEPQLQTNVLSTTNYQNPNLTELNFLDEGMGRQQQQTGNRPTVIEGNYVNQVRLQYSGSAPGSQVKGHMMNRRKNVRESATSEISQWSQWLKGSASAPVY